MIEIKSTNSWRTMKAFISYSHKDSNALDRLHVHLAILRREKRIDTWFDRDILAGDQLDDKITEQLEASEIFLLLVSPDFLASDYCYNREMTRALERHEADDARVIPIIVEPCDWKSSPLRMLKALPNDAKPVSEWTNENTAYLDIVQSLKRILEVENAKPTAEPINPIKQETQPSRESRRYRVKQDYDEIDRGEFRDHAFATFKSYFEQAIAEINGIDSIRGRFVSISASSFGSTVVNRRLERGTANITVHGRTGGIALWDIYYTFQENAPPNTANGGFSVDADEFDLYLVATMPAVGRDQERMSPEDAAERLWTDFLGQAGISYD